MKKSIGAVMALAMTFCAVAASAPAYATYEKCPKGSFQGYEGSTVQYVSSNATDAERASVTKLKDLSVGTDGKISGGILATAAQCNMNGNELKNSDLMATVNKIANVIVSVLGILAVVVIVLGGVQYVTSSGDPGKVKKAKDTILYGIIGLMVALLAYGIVNFILSSIWG